MEGRGGRGEEEGGGRREGGRREGGREEGKGWKGWEGWGRESDDVLEQPNDFSDEC